MKILKLVFRIVLGMVFTFSGIVKAIDPLGSAYKFTDYFTEAFGMPSLSAISLTLAVILNAAEFLVGISLLFNVKPRFSALGALLFMLVFTPLTLYIAIASPVEDCGCFGDAIKLSNWETFYKNLILLPMAVFLFISTKGEFNSYKGKIDWILAAVFLGIILLFQQYNLRHLPIIDFRPYKVGTYIPDKMKMPANEKADEYAVFYTLKHMQTGEIKELSDQEYLAQWTEADSIWEIIKTSEPKLVKKGYTPPIYNFTAYPININKLDERPGEDVMPQLLSDENYSFFVISYELGKASRSGMQKLSTLLNYTSSKNIQTHFLTSTATDLDNYLPYINFPVKYYNCDPITLKTIIRSNPGLLMMKKGTIIGKWHYNDVPSVEEIDNILNGQN